MSTTTSRPRHTNRGNSADRARSRAFLLAWWGDGERCQCVYCGRVLREVPAAEQATVKHGRCHPDHVSRDKIEPRDHGPGYVRTNLVPACISCNVRRDEQPFEAFCATVGVDPAPILAHALASPKRGFIRK